MAAARSQGLAALDGIEAVVLETDGSFSVITDGAGDSRSTLDGVNVPGPNERAFEAVAPFTGD